MDKTVTMRYRMTDRDNYYGGMVNGARNITLLEETARRLMAKVYNNVGRCVEVVSNRLLIPAYSGNYIEYIARVREEKDNIATIEVRSFLINEIPEPRPFPSSVSILEDPPLASRAIFCYEIPR